MTTSRPLYELAPEYAALEDELDAAGGEFTPELMARFDAASSDLKEKLVGCAYIIKNNQGEAEKHSNEARKQANIAAVCNRKADSVKAYVAYCLKMAGLTKVAGVASMRGNGGAPSVKFDGDPKDLPEGFRTVIYGYDRDAILTAYAAKLPLPAGVTVERGQHVHLDL